MDSNLEQFSRAAASIKSVFASSAWVNLGRYIRERRTDLNVSQNDLAAKIGFSPQFLGRIERGKAPIPASAFKKIIRELQLDQKKVTRIFIEGATEFVDSLYANIRHR